MLLPGAATTRDTAAYHNVRSAHPSHRRSLNGLTVSAIGLGTYLGDPDDRTDLLSTAAIREAIAMNCNVLDTAVNYRCQRSERTIGSVLDALSREGAYRRESLVICTKGGYLPFESGVPANPSAYVMDAFIKPGLARYEDIVGGLHCLAPRYLEHSLTTSLKNLQLETVDVFYLHNPEEQLAALSRDAFMQRMRSAFELLEEQARRGRIGCYGVATWNGFRVNSKADGYLSLEALVHLAREVGGPEHRFRAIQLPYSVAMPEAFVFKNQMLAGEAVTLLDAAQRLDISVVASATLLQSRLARMPDAFAEYLPGCFSSAQRALQFVRSTPGIACGLVGMKSFGHVRENLWVAGQAPIPAESLATMFKRPGNAGP